MNELPPLKDGGKIFKEKFKKNDKFEKNMNSALVIKNKGKNQQDNKSSKEWNKTPTKKSKKKNNMKKASSSEFLLINSFQSPR